MNYLQPSITYFDNYQTKTNELQTFNSNISTYSNFEVSEQEMDEDFENYQTLKTNELQTFNSSVSTFSSFEVSKQEMDEDLAFLTQKEQSDRSEHLKPKATEKTAAIFKKRAFKPKNIRKQVIEEENDLDTAELIQTALSAIRERKTQPKEKKQKTVRQEEQTFELPTVTQAPQTGLLSTRLLKEFKAEDLAALRFSQQTINCTLNNNMHLFETTSYGTIPLFDILRTQGWSKKMNDRIDVVLMPDGRYTSMDNRRLAVAKTIQAISHSIEVLAIPHYHNQEAPGSFLNRIASFNLPSPVGDVEIHTYGHAITSRIQIGRQGKSISEQDKYGFESYPTVITGLRGRGAKQIVIDSFNKNVRLV